MMHSDLCMITPTRITRTSSGGPWRDCGCTVIWRQQRLGFRVASTIGMHPDRVLQSVHSAAGHPAEEMTPQRPAAC